MNVASLAVKIAIKGGEKSVSTLKNLTNASWKTKAGLMAVVVAFAKMSQEARRFAQDLDISRTLTGLSTDAIQKLSYRATEAGVPLANIVDTLKNIQQMTTDIALGQGNIAPFQLWGVGLSNDPTRVLDQITKKLKALQKTNPVMAAKMARDFGLSDEMYYTLLQEETEQLHKQFLLKEKDKEILLQLNREWHKTWWYVKQLGIKMQGFLAHIAFPLVKVILRMVQMVGEIVVATGEWIENTAWIQKTLVIVSLLILTILGYCFPLTAALVGIALVIEDIYGYFTGKDSITGRMVEWIKSGQILKDIFNTIWEIIRSISTLLFGAEFTKKLTDFMEYRDKKSGALKGKGKEVSAADIVALTKPQMPNLYGFAKPALATGMGGINITQHNVGNFVARGAQEDGETMGEFASESAQVSDAMYQNSQMAHR